MLEEKQKSFLDELQSLDELIKRRVLIVATALVMIAVVYFWFGYFNSLVAGSSQAPVAENQKGNSAQGGIGQAYQSAEGSNITGNFTQGLKTVIAAILGWFDNVAHWLADAVSNIIRSSGQYTVQPLKS